MTHKGSARKLIEAGNSAWTEKHSYTGNDEAWHNRWESTIPNYGCSCRKDYAEYKAANPPDFSSPTAYWLWGVHLHNWVNRKLGKTELTIEEALAIWRRQDGVETQQTTTQCNRDQLRVDQE
jgi:hypothetical protein